MVARESTRGHVAAGDDGGGPGIGCHYASRDCRGSYGRRAGLLRRAGIWLLYLPALGLLLLYAWAFLDHGWSVVSFPYQVDYGEAPELNRAVLLAQGRPIYVDWSQPPYQMANYTPLYSAATAMGVKLAGVQFLTGRVISFASTLATGACIAATAWGLRAGVLGAVVGGLLYFVAHPVWNWGAYQRVDAFAMLWEWLGVVVFVFGWVRRRRAAAVWTTVPLFLAAAYSRQTIAAGAFACYGYLLFRRPRLALGAVAAYAAGGLLVFGLLQLLSGGQFWRHIVFGNLNRWSWGTVDSYWQPFWRLMHWAIILAAVGALLAAIRRRPQVPLLYLAASAATALTIGKVGSSFNYLLQLCAALALLGGLAAGQMAWLFESLPSRVRRPLSHQADPAARIGAAAGRRSSSPRGRGGQGVRFGALAKAFGDGVALCGASLPALWLLVGLQQAYHAPYTMEGSTVLVHQPEALLDQLGVTRRLWRLDPWAAPPDALPRYWRDYYRPNPSAGDRVSAQRTEEYVATLDGDVLSEDMTFTVTTGKRIYVQPFEFTQLAEQGEWDRQPLLDAIRRQQFAAVLLRFRLGENPGFHAQRIDEPLMAAIDEAYRLDASFDSYFLYRPK